MIPLSHVLAQFGDPNHNVTEPESGHARNFDDITAPITDVSRVSSPWNPTGDIFDLRPDLAHTPIAELAGALLEMRRLLRSTDETINRLQLMRFERQYSNALWRRAASEKIDTVTINGSLFRLLLTEGMDIVLLPAS